jgi:hypothetical protein
MSLLFLEWRSLRAESKQRLLSMRDRYEALWLAVIREVTGQGRASAEPFVIRKLLTGAIARYGQLVTARTAPSRSML